MSSLSPDGTTDTSDDALLLTARERAIGLRLVHDDAVVEVAHPQRDVVHELATRAMWSYWMYSGSSVTWW